MAKADLSTATTTLCGIYRMPTSARTFDDDDDDDDFDVDDENDENDEDDHHD